MILNILRNKVSTFCIMCLLILVFLWICVPVGAQGSGLFIVPPQGEIVSGKETRFNLFIHNPETKPHTTKIYGRVMVTLVTPNDILEVEAYPVNENSDFSITIPAQGYLKQEYTFILPEQMTGNIKLSLEAFGAGPVLFAASPPPLVEQTEQLSLGEKESFFQPFVDNLSAYQPIYFLFGIDPGIEKSKFQVSFKYKLFNDPFDSQMVNGFVDGFHLAYTQTSYWDLSSDSKPFDDTSYKPELFYLIPKIDMNTSWIKAFGIQTGFQHESNGQDGDISRSTNFAYIEPRMGFSLSEQYFLVIAPKVWAYVGNDDDTNPDLSKYRGYFNFQAKIGNPKGFVLDTNTRWAEKGPSFQADLSYPLTFLFSNKLNLYLHFQYFNGYAERLIEYQKKEEILRIGFSLTR